MKKSWIIATVASIAGVGFLIFNQSSTKPEAPQQKLAMVAVTVPASFSTTAEKGKALFKQNCAACHGDDAAGQAGVAPPLIHKIYEPSHHGDESFQRAAALGTRAHHWTFGNMPAIEGVKRPDVEKIIAYVRELQRANGIN